MQQIEIIIRGIKYPCRSTKQARKKIQKLTGKRFNRVEQLSLSECLKYIYYCCETSAKEDGFKFPYSMMEFADLLSPEYMMKLSKESSNILGDFLSNKKTDIC